MRVELNQVILGLHRAAIDAPLRSYRSWALTELQGQIAFDYGLWGSVSPSTDILHDLEFKFPVRSVVRRRPVPRRLKEWLQNSADDAHALQWTGGRKASALRPFLRIERNGEKRAFSKPERVRFELLAPHLVGAWENCMLLNLHARSALEEDRVAALVDPFGWLRVADSRFPALVRQVWPEWDGAALPPALQQLAGAYVPPAEKIGAQVYGGIRWSAEWMGGLVYVSGRQATARLWS